MENKNKTGGIIIKEFGIFPSKEWIDNYYKTNKQYLLDNVKYDVITKEMGDQFRRERENEK